MRRNPQIEVSHFFLVAFVALGFLCLPLERSEAALELADDVRDTQEVLARLIHLAFGGALAQLELADARGLFDHRAAILGLGGDDEADAALLDDRVRALPDACAQEKVRDVEETDRRAVDEVVAVALAIETPGHLNLRVIAVVGWGEPISIVEGQRDLGEPVGSPTFGAAEDDVLHVLATEARWRLLAHAPLDGVHDVGLAATIGPDDTGDVMVEMDRRRIDEGFEANDLELLDLHSAPQRSSWTWLSLNIRDCNGLRDQKRGSARDPHYMLCVGHASRPRLEAVWGFYSFSTDLAAAATEASVPALTGGLEACRRSRSSSR